MLADLDRIGKTREQVVANCKAADKDSLEEEDEHSLVAKELDLQDQLSLLEAEDASLGSELEIVKLFLYHFLSLL